jgi:hypothetical protein
MTVMLSPISAGPGFATKKFVKKRINKLRTELQGKFLGETVVITEQGDLQVDELETRLVPCPNGYQALGGGASSVDPPSATTVVVSEFASGPTVGGARPGATLPGTYAFADGWYVEVRNQSLTPEQYRVSIVCAKPAA